MTKNNIIITVLVALLIGVLSGGGVYLWQQNEIDSLNSQLQTAQMTSMQQDSDTQTPANTDTSNSQNTPSEPQQPVKTDEQLITEAIAAKHNKPVADTDLTVNANDGQHAQGLVKFAGEVAGGWWLAAKSSGDWIIVADGNGVVMCDDIAPYNFPTSMVPECYDASAGQTVTR